jgi:hypothetical protein
METVIQKTAKTQIRIGLSDFKDRRVVNIREYFLNGEDYIPTKKGLTVPPELLEEVIEGLSKLKGKTAKQVVQVKEAVSGFSVARTTDDVALLKKHFFDTVEEALTKTPPDGFKLFKIKIEEGVVTKHKLLYKRQKGSWAEYERTNSK